MQVFTKLGLGNNIATLAGYAFSTNTNDRIGAIDIVFENYGGGAYDPGLLGNSAAGNNIATVTIGQYNGSGYSQLVAPFTVAPHGTVTQHLVVFSSRIGIFGSGNTTIGVQIPTSMAAALRGSAVDIVPLGRQNWSFDVGADPSQNFPAPLS